MMAFGVAHAAMCGNRMEPLEAVELKMMEGMEGSDVSTGWDCALILVVPQ